MAFGNDREQNMDSSAIGEAREALRSSQRALHDSNARFEALTNVMPQMVWSTLPDGYHDYYNARWYEFTGVPPGSTDGEGWADLFHPDDQELAWARWRHSLATGEPYEVEYRLRHHSGEYLWTLGRALPVRDNEGRITRWIGTCTEIDHAKREAERNLVLSRELSHRIKNIFAIISGLIGLSARRDPNVAGFARELQQRIAALGRAHEFVRPFSDQSPSQIGRSTLHAMLREIFAPYPDMERRFSITGDDVPVDDKGATPIALVFHELATNSAKYGALTAPDGTIEVRTHLDQDILTITWRERGGPVVAGPPDREGFGSKLTRMSAEQQLGGTIERHWEPDGLCVRMTVLPSRLAHQ